MSNFTTWREAPEAQFAVVGNPVSHSLSPRMHTAIYRKLRLLYDYKAIQVEPGELEPALTRLRSIGYQGINVTVPLKEEALEWSERAEPFAKQARAANTLRLATRHCINTDGPGFIDTLEPFGIQKKSAIVLGAGGSARAIALALLNDGFEIFLYNRTHAKAVALAEEIGLSPERVRKVADPADVSLIVNTTSASLQNDEIPIDWTRADPHALAYDLMYSAEPTPFMASASHHGLRTLDGRRMLVAQGARSFEWWVGIEAPRDVMLEAIQ